MVGTIILGATFKISTSSHRAGFTRSYPHRIINKKISSNALVPTKTWLPNRVYIFNTIGSPTLCSSPTRFINIFIPNQDTSSYFHPQAETMNPQLSILKTRSKHQALNDVEIYLLNQTILVTQSHNHTS